MRSLFALLLLPAFALAQTADEKKATLKFIDSLRDPETGAWAVSPPKDGEKLKPSLRAVNGAVNALKFFGGEVTDKEKVTKFVLSCYDEKTGAFAEPGDKPSVAMTSVGVLAATAVGIPKEKYKGAAKYVMDNCKAFEDFRIGAAAFEALGVKTDEDEFIRWMKEGVYTWSTQGGDPEATAARGLASLAAMRLRLDANAMTGELKKTYSEMIQKGQKADGGWGKYDAKTSDAETTYRVMRALMLMKEKPKDADGVTKFVASCRRKDGGYGVDAEAPSSMSGVYYAAKISEWNK